EGEIVTLIGANGAGKSTTLRTISGMNKPRKGEVVYRGKSIHKFPADKIVGLGIGHVPEGRRIFPRMTVEENLEMGGFLINDARVVQERKEQAFTLFPRLAERRQQKGGTLSGGEQQMLAIGRTLMQDPKLLLMDEPSMGLAPVLVDFIFEIIQKLNQQGKTILLVEQNARLALQIAHRGYVLQTGHLTMSGPAKELAARPEIQEAYLGGH
ncbi:ABC transporter ATP-binding protein, partial [uncultured Meiothermus sp.]|uniref:ABC transporter ATP-binding protein n=1 Tax=uncultured Meiothermus sp. TaxID=157471 RepID=UPI00262CE6BC